MKLFITLLAAICLLPGMVSALTADDLVKLSRGLTPEVAQRAIDALGCAADSAEAIDKLIVVDMSLASRSKRLWAFDVADPHAPRLVLSSRVAHGSGSDRTASGVPTAFSDTPDSHMTSLGLYRVAERYHGRNGVSRRLDGLFRGFNSNARARAVVMHPSDYVSGMRVGRSQGCPAVSHETMAALERAGLSNAVLWIDAPDRGLMAAVEDCARKREARIAAKKSDDARPGLVRNNTLAYETGQVQIYSIPDFLAAAVQIEQLADANLVWADPSWVLPVDRLLAVIEARSDEGPTDPFTVPFRMSPASVWTPWIEWRS